MPNSLTPLRLELEQLYSRTDLDVNHSLKLDWYRNFLETWKKIENEKEHESELEHTIPSIVQDLLIRLHQTTSKDMIRKVIIRSINAVTKRSVQSTETTKAIRAIGERAIVTFLADQVETIGQKLFILNIYLENLDNFGIECMCSIKSHVLQTFYEWCSNLLTQFKESTAPIVTLNLVNTLQLLAKTMVIFLQRCECGETNRERIAEFCTLIRTGLDEKEIFKVELGYAFSMLFVLLNNILSDTSLRKLILECLEVYESQPEVELDMRSLCLFQALLTMLKPAQFASEHLLDLYERILLLTLEHTRHSSHDIVYAIGVSRTVHFWLIKLVEMVETDQVLNDDIRLLSADAKWFPQLISYTWSHCDTNVDVIKNTSLENYKRLLKLAKSIRRNDDELQAFYVDELTKCMRLPWQSNAKLRTLISLIDDAGLKATHILALNADVAEELIGSITERSSACLVADVYSRLYESHRASVSMRLDDARLLVEVQVVVDKWWRPIVRSLESSAEDKAQQAYTYEYILPRMLKISPDGLQICQKLSSGYSAVIACAKVTRSLHSKIPLALSSSSKATAVSASSSSSDTTLLFGCLPLAVLEKCIAHESEQVRLDSLALVCENPRTSEPALGVELALVKKFLYYNCDLASPSSRQTALSSLKKLFFRLKESWLNSAKRRQRQASEFEELTEKYREFVEWLLEFAYSFIHLDSTFAKRNQSLLILTHFYEQVGWQCTAPDSSTTICLFDESHLTRARLVTLIQCLWDSYENNKSLALALLDRVNRTIYEKSNIAWSEYLSVAIGLLSSRRPVDAVTSVYLCMFLQAKARLSDLLDSRRPVSCVDHADLTLFLVKAIRREFEAHCAMAKSNLLRACLEQPIYGPLAALHSLIVKSVHKMKCKSGGGDAASDIAEWKGIIESLIELCLDVSKVTSQIVNSNSPEGIFPTELVQMQPESAGPSNDDDERRRHVDNVTPQMLLVCCWRTMKEISLFFGDLVTHLPIEHNETGELVSDSAFILSSLQVFKIGNYFVRHLFETRHRGAFELAYVGFTSVCSTFWRSTSAMYCDQPGKWLDEIMRLIQSAEESRSKLCSTRRGGGLPFLFQAIISTEMATTRRTTLARSMRLLLALAESEQSTEERQTTTSTNEHDLTFSKVLAMYVLTALFKDTRIGEDMLAYAESALVVAIDGFDSPYWNVRNASTLLFAALMSRMFGVSRARDHVSVKNSMSARVFFAKCPLLYAYFATIIGDSVRSIGTNMNVKLYLVALVLGHLFTAGGGEVGEEALLHNYVPDLLKCLKSPVMKTRLLTAKAIASIVNMHLWPELIERLVGEELAGAWRARDFNQLHALLELVHMFVHKCANLFAHVSFDSLMTTTGLLLTEGESSIAKCATTSGSLLKLGNELFWSQQRLALDTEQQTRLATLLVRLDADVLATTASRANAHIPSPNAHECFAHIGESLAIALHLGVKEASEAIRFVEVTYFGEKGLGNELIELSTSLIAGIAQFMNKRQERACMSMPLTDDLCVRQLFEWCKTRVLASLLQFRSIDNRLDIRNSCDLLAYFLRADVHEDTHMMMSKEEARETWQCLLDALACQTESATRVVLLKLVTFLFKHADNQSIDKLLELLEQSTEHAEEASCVAQFLEHNCALIFGLSEQSLGVNHSLSFWSLLMTLLIDKRTASGTAVTSCLQHIFVRIKGDKDHFSQYDSMVYIKLAIEMIVSLHWSRDPCATFAFFLEQFKTMSACESTTHQQDDDETMEVVFDRGIEPVHTSYYIYLNELIHVVESLISRERSPPAITQIFNESYALICQWFQEELEFTIGCTSANQMRFADIKHTKLKGHAEFLNKMAQYATSDNQLTWKKLELQLNATKSVLNCFINSDLF